LIDKSLDGDKIASDLQTEGRIHKFARNHLLEDLLQEINSDLAPIEKSLIKKQSESDFPIILIMGPARSGTTLFLQCLADTGAFAYPTNLLSRFYGAPVVGSKIQLLLTDPKYNFNDELSDFKCGQDFKSENGKTKGALAPNEFWYFWRRFLPDLERDHFTNLELQESMDSIALLSELNGIMDVLKKPFAAKGMLFNYNISFFDKLFKKAIFIQIKRDPLMNIQSLLSARERQFGAHDRWYSFRIKEYEKLITKDPIAQVAGQVACINRAIARSLKKMDEERKVIVSYEAFCKNPEDTLRELSAKLIKQGCDSLSDLSISRSFTPKTNLTMSKSDCAMAKNFYDLCRAGDDF